jgi:fumarate reductase flavoprotein subunit
MQAEWSVPVVVIGGGACGLCAALAAREGGAEVLVLERDHSPAGSTALSTGLIPAAGTKLQQDHGVDDSADRFAADLLAKAKHQTDAHMARVVAAESGPAVDWLMDSHGVTLTLVDDFLYPGHSRHRMHGTPHRSGAELEAALLAAANRQGIDILTDAHATALFADDAKRIRGVRIERPDGSHDDIGCAALVLACNGFGGNPAMVAELIPEMREAVYFGHTGNQGDAIVWGRALGARTADLGSYQGHGSVAHPHGVLIMWGLISAGGIQVNGDGKRFADETRGYSEQAIDVLNQPGHVAWTVYDARCEAVAANFTDYQNARAMGAIREADTIAELAIATDAPETALRETLDGVADMCAGKAVDPLGRDFRVSTPLTPPYRAVRVTGALFHTQGGLVVDANARVVGADGQPLPNLLAGGGAARGLSGPSRWGYLSGNGLLTAIVLGRLAGRTAADVAR